MAGTNATKIYIGTLEQSKTTGALMRGPVLTTIPTTFAEALAAISQFVSCGYLSDEGPTLTTELDTAELREHNGGLVRKPVNTFDATLEAHIMQADADGWKMCVGEDNVTVVAATTEHGEQLHIKLGAHLPEDQAWALRVKDGDMRMIVLFPNGQLTSELEVTFAAGEAITLPVSISGYDDGSGVTVHIYMDDGAKSAAADTTLAALTVGTLRLDPLFSPGVTAYAASTTESSVNVTGIATDATATVTVKNGDTSVGNGGAASLSAGENVIKVTVTNGTATKDYTVTVTKS